MLNKDMYCYTKIRAHPCVLRASGKYKIIIIVCHSPIFLEIIYAIFFSISEYFFLYFSRDKTKYCFYAVTKGT